MSDISLVNNVLTIGALSRSIAKAQDGLQEGCFDVELAADGVIDQGSGRVAQHRAMSCAVELQALSDSLALFAKNVRNQLKEQMEVK
tara:strand:- start:314 stop:574 length:261 start_codon:yes stop_codon:yes gene_type:complete